jgi:hypothetical protein
LSFFAGRAERESSLIRTKAAKCELMPRSRAMRELAASKFVEAAPPHGE